mmetsp:Transcript_25626/g.66528  ORF Transcript_25626/g.66528 Transcript_25626/m.66528 type:complete len:226 (-) Transcript_25626:346-1023(-)
MDEGRRRLLDDLLVAALDGALALREAGHVAVRVGHELDLDVARRRDELLDQQPVVPKGLLGLVRREGEALGDLARVAGHAHALAAAARARFEHDRVADVLGDGDGVLRRLDDAVEARDHAHAGRLRDFFRFDLVAHGVDRRGRRAHESNARLGAALREGRVLGEEAVARMDAVGARRPRGLQHRVGVEVGCGGGRPAADLDCLISELHVLRARVGLAVDRDRVEA